MENNGHRKPDSVPSTKEYFAREGSPYGQKDAEIIGPELERIIRNGWQNGVPEGDDEKTFWTILQAASAPGSALRRYLEWDDLKAADQWRIAEIRQMCSAIWCRIRTPEGISENPVVVALRVQIVPVEHHGHVYRARRVVLAEDARLLPAEVKEATFEDEARTLRDAVRGLLRRFSFVETAFTEEFQRRFPATEEARNVLERLERELGAERREEIAA